jgi:hypothetical protein
VFAHLNPRSSDFGNILALSSPFLVVACVPVVVCVARKLRPCPSYSRRRDRINLVSNFNLVPNVVQPHKTWVSRICQSHRVMDTFVVSVCPLEPTPFLSPLLQVMILVTPMMLALNLFGLRLPEVCGNGPCLSWEVVFYKRPHARQFHSQELEVA